MVILSQSDLFDVKLSSLLAGYDRDTLSNLYQPIIGYGALAVYFTLWSEANNEKILSFSTHEQLLIRMKMPTGAFVDARKTLEAVGLIKTRLEKAPGVQIFHYQMLAPKTPKDFFKDTLLYGMLIQTLGEEEADRIKKVYEAEKNHDEGEDISSTFNDIFHPDFDNPSFMKAANESSKFIGRNKSKIKTEFNYETFFIELAKICAINENSLNKKEMKEIERISSLYGADEKIAAFVVSNAYDSNKEKGSRIDLEQVNKELMNEVNYTFNEKKALKKKTSEVDSDTLLASKINLFETTSPKDILRLLQNGTKVAISDLKIIDALSKDYRLSNGVINVIIDFVLSMNQNVLSRSFAEKMAASFNREKIATTIDAMNYCNAYLNKNSNKVKTETKTSSSIKKNKENVKISEEEWNNLIKEESEDTDGKIESELPF